MDIGSISNRKLTLLRKLNQKKYRQQEGLFIVEGARAVQQIIENDRLNVQQFFFDESQRYWEQEPWQSAALSIDSSTVEADDYAEVSDTDNPQGVMALCEISREVPLNEMVGESGVILATDAIQDPGNLGTIIRTASWFGIQGLLSGKGTVDLFHPKVVRSTAGATGTVAYANVDLNESLAVFEDNGWQVVLLDAGPKSVPLQQVEKREKMVIVVGNEGNGIDQSLFGFNDVKARIQSPRTDQNVESLNAAIATSIALYALA